MKRWILMLAVAISMFSGCKASGMRTAIEIKYEIPSKFGSGSINMKLIDYEP